ncbi:hypothetical protein BKA62DRAFT_740998 [Auriculariales sp. MPI-PUGE-AT-0066]|nr:hypothetical protein BKA62DRAFT_740998 [Auriculariales sp. MPI-PUGE-AT-0066]
MLPPELVHNIFAFIEWPYDLPSAALTCRLFASCGSIALARNLFIPARLAHQDRIVIWLKRLLAADSTDLRAAVTCVILDDVAKPLHPTIPRRGEFERVPRNRYADEEFHQPFGVPIECHQIHYLLQELLPQLHNIYSIYLRRVSTLFPLDAVQPAAAAKFFGSTRLARGKAVLKTILRDSGPAKQPTMEETPPARPDLWQLLLSPETKPKIRELFLCCQPGDPPTVPDASLLRSITTLTIHDIDCRMPGANAGETLWTSVLTACAPTLRHLCIVRILGFAALVAYTPPDGPTMRAARITKFPHLFSFEAYKLVIRGHDSQALALFLETHSPTLEVLAIGVRCDPGNALLPAAHFVRSSWLDDEHVLANLRILRMENAEFLQRWITPPNRVPAVQTLEVKEQLRRATALRVAQFVRERPNLRDVSFHDLPETDAVSLRDELKTRPGGGRAYVGNERKGDFDQVVPESPSNERAYLWSAWVFYSLLFKGLVLERSGIRPFLPAKKVAPRSTPTSHRDPATVEYMR